MRTALVWFRRDLRVHDHPALTRALREHERVIPVFVLDPSLLHGRFASRARTDFMLGCLAALDAQLRERGSALVVRAGHPEHVLVQLASECHAETVLWTSDVSPHARARDRRVSEALSQAGVSPQPHGGNYITDVSRLRTQAGDPYHVFSPFFRTWSHVERRKVERAPGALPPLPEGLDPGKLPRDGGEIGVEAGHAIRDPLVAPGEPAARKALSSWLRGSIEEYARRQDGVARLGTSQLSPYLRWGCISPREAEQRAQAHGGPGANAWVRQLCWREFYAHVLLHWPQNARREFQPRMRGLEYEADEERLEAWRTGHTGYPIVDAGMRQLSATGWMHNRARLIVGSFLTKDLQLDWREGEQHFERLLLDGEPAQNNGNWQWIASVGTDPAPAYRRTYNPTLQARRFDPDGSYVRLWVPELGGVPTDQIHEPWTLSATEQNRAGCRLGRDYPAPVVDHQHERRRALERYRRAAAA